MEKPSLNIVRAADIAAHAQEFSHPWNPNSLMRGTQLGRSVGLKRTGVNFIRVPAGTVGGVMAGAFDELVCVMGIEPGRDSTGPVARQAGSASVSAFPGSHF